MGKLRLTKVLSKGTQRWEVTGLSDFRVVKPQVVPLWSLRLRDRPQVTQPQSQDWNPGFSDSQVQDPSSGPKRVTRASTILLASSV